MVWEGSTGASRQLNQSECTQSGEIQGPRLSSEFPRVCRSISMHQGKLHGPKECVPCVVIRRQDQHWGFILKMERQRSCTLTDGALAGVGRLEGSEGSTQLFFYYYETGWTKIGELVLLCTPHLEESSGLYPHGQTERCQFI